LLAQDFVIEAVVTKPRAAHHKGDVPVISLAEKLGLPLLTAENKEQLDELFGTKPFKSRLGVLIDFGIIVSQQVIDYFPLGIINSHFSVLPEWRGADPITFSILSGQKVTGVSLMFLVAAMDEGALLAYGEQPLKADITTPELTGQLIILSHELLTSELPRLMAGKADGGMPQSVTGRQVSYSRKLTKNDGLIDWKKPAVQIEREIRAFIEWPKSKTNFGDLAITLTKGHVVDQSGPVGSRTIIGKLPAVHCGAKTLVIERLKPAGKQEMTGEAFLAGYKKQFLET